jgi:hypothetical protein
MNKNLVHTLASERKRAKTSHKITSTKGTFIQMCHKRMTHVQLITFLKRDVVSRYLLR